MTKQDDINTVRYYIKHARRGVKYEYLPYMINTHDDDEFYLALDQIHRLGNMNSRDTKEAIIFRILDWYESKQ